MEEQTHTTAGQAAGEHTVSGTEKGPGVAGKRPARAGKPGLRSVEYLILGLVVLLVMVLVAGGVFIWTRYEPAGKVKEHPAAPPEMAAVELEPFFVPLKSLDEPEKFLLVTPVLELAEGASPRIITGKMEEVRVTMLQIFLGALPTELDYPQGNKELIDTMVSSLNRCLKADVVTGIRFNHAAVI